MKILVSACLLGVSCRYNGEAAVVCPPLLQLSREHQLIPICPEVMGGLPTPREPAELWQGRAITRSGADVTAAFVRGVEQVLRLAEFYHCHCAILKEHSPSCGSGVIHDGTFGGKLVAGDGLLAAALKAKGFTVIGESQLADSFALPAPHQV